MKILVTGGAGYIGSHTCVELVQAGYEIVVVDNFVNSCMEAIRRVRKLCGTDFPFEEVDLTDPAATEALFQKYEIDAVMHFAGLKAVGESVKIPVAYYRNNLDSTLSLLEAMLRHIDFPTLAQAVRHNLESVHAFTLDTDIPGVLAHRGKELFGSRAARLLIIPNERIMDCEIVSRFSELWMVDYGQMLTTSTVRFQLDLPCLGSLEIAYREQGRYPWESGVKINLAELTRNLRQMCLPVYQGRVPIYEM